MKGLLIVFSIFCLFFVTGCSDIKRMNTNMEESIQSVHQNTNTVQHSSEVISKNTAEVARSTSTMKTYFPILLIVLIAVLAYPFFMLIKLQRKILHDIRALVERLRK